MQNESKKQRTEHFYFMAALAESIIDASDEEIEELIREEGDNGDEVRNVLRESMKLGRRRVLAESREMYEARLVTFEKTSFDLPSTPAEKRALLQAMLGQMARGQQALTAQFRDFESLPDEDLDGILRQLIDLSSDERTEK